MNVRIPRGIFSKLYRFENGLKKNITYNTPRQAIALFEGDSAEVWQLIYEHDGNCQKALEYVSRNGKFQDRDGDTEAKNTLAVFIDNLKKLHLLMEKDDASSFPSFVIPKKEITARDRVSPLVNTEMSISQLMSDHHIFYSLTLELTYRCNERCVHCYCPSNRDIDEMSVDTIASLLGQFKSLGGFKVQLTGGEIFIRKDIKDILTAVAESGLVADITSNLTLMREDTFKIIQEMRPRAVGCSIYSARALLHDQTTMVAGSFDKSIFWIKKLRSAGIPVAIKTPLMSHTAQYWKEIESLADELGCEYQLDLNITAKNDGGKDPVEHRVKDTTVLAEIMSSRFYKLYINDEPLNLPKAPSTEAVLCGAGANGLTVSPDGTIRPCLGLSTRIGSFPQDSLEKIWQESDFFHMWSSKKLNNIEKCSKCSKIAFCNRCPGAWLAENGSCDMPSDYTCFLAGIWASAQNK